VGPVTIETRAVLDTFFGALFGDAAEGEVIELRAFRRDGPVDRTFAPLADRETWLQFLARHARERDCYVGCATRNDASSGTLDNCASLGVIFVDIDFKVLPESDARRRLDTFPLPPSLVVHSGHGLHAYWWLHERLDLTTDDGRTHARDLLERLALALGADRSAAEPARVLRVPMTYNYKDEPVRVVMEQCDPERRYSPWELDELLPEAPPLTGNAGAGFQAQEQVGQGDRHLYLFRLARSLKTKSLSPEAVRATLLVENQQACAPPLPDSEVERQVVSAFAQADRPGFEPRRGRPDGDHPRQAEAELAPTPPPLVMAEDAYYGLAGRIVRTIEPFSEADPVAILAHLLVAAGNVLGRAPHTRVEKTLHPCNEFVALVGRTSKGRKGQSWSTPRHLLAQVDPDWAAKRIKGGLSSGEGVIYNVRDARDEQQPIKERGRIAGYQRVVVDAGEPDKRLLVVEPELAVVLRRMNGEANSLSAILRDAWDTGHLSTLTKNSPLRATGAFISIVAHITSEELVSHLTHTERANGFANRFLFLLVARSKVLPEPEPVPDEALTPHITAMQHVMSWAETPRLLVRDERAKALWAEVYPSLSEGEAGLIGAILGRAEAHVLRLSTLYAVLDCSPVITADHLRAALAVWDYAEASARRIFGDALGLSVADTILAALRTRGPMTREAIRDLFHRNKSSEDLGAALKTLLHPPARARVSTRRPEGGKGRPAEVWEAVDHADKPRYGVNRVTEICP
jgi:Protein of unknown function (DUF3987)/Primase C terminal 1 (PriCT-1)